MNALADVHLLLIGKTGHGRSATGNSILGRQAFNISSAPSSLTSEIECALSEFNRRRVKIVDGPGVGHTHVNKKKAFNLFMASMEYAIAANSHGYDAFLLVVKFGVKYTTKFKESVDCYRKIFGQDFVRNFCILVVTGGDLFNQEPGNIGKSVDEWIDEHPSVLRDLANECQRRVVLFDDVTTNETTRHDQVEKLLKIVADLKSKGGRLYTDEDFAHAREGRQCCIAETQKAQIQEEVIEETNLILNESERIQSVKDLETKLVQIQALQNRAQNLFTKIALLDKGTGVVNGMSIHVKLMQHYLDKSIKCNEKSVNKSDMTNQKVETTHLAKGVQQTEDSDATTASVLWCSSELKATNTRQEIEAAENCGDNKGQGKINTQKPPQNEIHQEDMKCQHTRNTEDEETCVYHLLENNTGAAPRKIPMPDSNQVDLLLIGHSGMGISETGNSILRRRAFLGCKAGQVTKAVNFSVSEFNGRTIKVVDTPGIEELEKIDFNSVIRAMQTAIAINPSGHNAFLLVFRYGPKLTGKYQFTIEVLKSVFGQDFIKDFCILVLTGGDSFEHDNEETEEYVRQWCNKQEKEFTDLVKECEGRVVLFDNLSTDLARKNYQIGKLLKVVDAMRSKGKRYSAENIAYAEIKHRSASK